MEQHPVPQQISSYEFRLVGDMTLKQFGLVAGGFIIALLFYATPLPGILKWPCIVISAFLGIATAFLPFEERPLQTWIIAFFKAAYSPTQYIWKKRGLLPAYFGEGLAVKATAPTTATQPQPEETKKMRDYLEIFRSPKISMEEEEKNFLDQIQNLFHTLQPPTPSATTVVEVKPIETTQNIKAEPIPQEPVDVPKYPFEMHQEPQYQPIVRYKPRLPGNLYKPIDRAAEAARFVQHIPLPSVPSLPNVLVGMVLDINGKIVQGAIIEIRDSGGNPVRAFRTNALGQFRIVTPLPSDAYEIEIEKEGLKFDIIKVSLVGEVVQPIEIRALGNP